MSRSRRRRTNIAGQWTAHRIDMLRSPAWRVLSLSVRRILDRIEIEHASHGGVTRSIHLSAERLRAEHGEKQTVMGLDG